MLTISKKKVITFGLLILGLFLMSSLDKVDTFPKEALRADMSTSESPLIQELTKVDEEVVLERTRDYSEDLVEFIKRVEGSPKKKGEPLLTAYAIGDGMVTIGWGHAERTSKTDMVPGKTTITRQRAEQLLKKDLRGVRRALNKILDDMEKEGINVSVTQGMYDSMMSMIFNMGSGNFKRTKFLNAS